MSAASYIQALWYRRSFNLLTLVLTPLSWVFGVVVALRRFAFRVRLLRVEGVSRPVIVVGNLTVGGTGKTPFTLWLAARLRARGYVPGIVLRGYGGSSTTWPREVSAESDPREVGDEAVLLATESGGIVVAGPDRVAAARRAIERGADVVVCDDGLQHYRLARDCEVAVVDAIRGLGNGLLLPAGPLREPPSRLSKVDALVMRAPDPALGLRVTTCIIAGAESMASFVVVPTGVRSLKSGEVRSLAAFAGQSVHAVAGIGYPEGFFATLRGAGITVIPHPLPDHAPLTAATFEFGDTLPVLMTGKDAVKCRGNNDPRLWVVAAEAVLDTAQAETVLAIVDARIASRLSNAKR
ncbi:MAG: tetraacyldisaccharide 4'-kinase [Steroidobacteraceae bacterium]